MDLRMGDIVFGETEHIKLKIIDVIGNGGFGFVFKVKSENEEIFALKTIPTATLDDMALNTLINEGKISTQIDHKNILKVFYFHDGKQYPELPPYMLMEYAEGGTLADLLYERKTRNEKFSLTELQNIYFELASGMKALNEVLVHRDIKPDNILIMKGTLKIADFGLSKVVGESTRSQTFKGINHLMYCAPEAWRLDKNLPSMDMYSMGITFYEIATLQHPFTVENRGNVVDAWKSVHFSKLPEDPRKYNNSVSQKLAQLIAKMIAKRPADRYQSWDEVIDRLQSDEIKEPANRSVSSLVELALEKHRREEQKKLEVEKREKDRMEQEDLIIYSFNEILKSCQEIVDSFNNQSEFLKLELIKSSSTQFSVISRKGAGGAVPSVTIKVEAVDNIKLRDFQTITAWGVVKAPSGRGFNLLLITRGEDDLYGQWQTLQVEHSPLVQPRDNRQAPFPFEFAELPREIHLLNAMHIYQTRKDIFNPVLFDDLIRELI